MPFAFTCILILGRLTDRNEVIKKGTAVTNDINKISCPILTRKYVPKLAGSNGMKCNGELFVKQ